MNDPPESSSEPPRGTEPPRVPVDLSGAEEDPIERLKRELPGFPEIPKPKPPPKPSPAITGAAKAIGLATNFIAICLAGGGLGYLLDRWLGSLPWGTIAGFFVGLIGSTVRIIRDLNADDRPARKP